MAQDEKSKAERDVQNDESARQEYERRNTVKREVVNDLFFLSFVLRGRRHLAKLLDLNEMSLSFLISDSSDESAKPLPKRIEAHLHLGPKVAIPLSLHIKSWEPTRESMSPRIRVAATIRADNKTRHSISALIEAILAFSGLPPNQPCEQRHLMSPATMALEMDEELVKLIRLFQKPGVCKTFQFSVQDSPDILIVAGYIFRMIALRSGSEELGVVLIPRKT